MDTPISQNTTVSTPVADPTLPGNPDSQLDFSVVKAKLSKMIHDWKPTRDKAMENRKTRDLDFSVETMRRESILDEDETMVPVRVIDTNITREQPPYINYIKNSRRLCIFTSNDNPDQTTDNLELQFTRGMTYTGWENAHFKILDGAATHGWDAAEVVFDTSKPLHVGIEQIGYDKLFWPRSCKDIQQANRVIREYDFTIIELQMFVSKHGWSDQQVKLIIAARKSSQREGETNKIYKELFKDDTGIIQVAWFSLENGVNDWLKAPTQHYVGIDEQDPQTGQWVPKALTEYPLFILPYRESEKPKLIDRYGRVFLDGNKQEAQTGLLSSYLNGLSRATKVLASPMQDNGTGNSIKELANSPIEGGTILDTPVNFYSPPYPDVDTLKGLQYLDVSNSQETNQTNFAVLNREDSRKTAKEMTLAEQQGNMLNSVQLTLFSTYFRGVYSFAWLVVQSQALQGLIKFLMIQVPQPQINPVTQQPVVDPMTGQPVMVPQWQNDIQTIGQSYDVRAAGDVDVIQKNERIQQMKQDWPVVQNTALAQQFLSDLIRLSYPDKGDSYAKTLEQGQQNEVKTLGGLAAGLTTVIQNIMKNHPEVLSSLTPENQQKLGQMIQAGEQVAKQQQQQNPQAGQQ